MFGTSGDKRVCFSGLYSYPESRWRQAILRFLFGIWSGDPVITARPEILLENVTIRLFNNRYVAFGRPTSEQPPVMSLGESLVAGDRKTDVEVALVQFVKNDRIKMVTLALGCNGDRFVALWKKERRGEFGFWAKNIPETWTAGC